MPRRLAAISARRPNHTTTGSAAELCLFARHAAGGAAAAFTAAGRSRCARSQARCRRDPPARARGSLLFRDTRSSGNARCSAPALPRERGTTLAHDRLDVDPMRAHDRMAARQRRREIALAERRRDRGAIDPRSPRPYVATADRMSLHEPERTPWHAEEGRDAMHQHDPGDRSIVRPRAAARAADPRTAGLESRRARPPPVEAARSASSSSAPRTLGSSGSLPRKGAPGQARVPRCPCRPAQLVTSTRLLRKGLSPSEPRVYERDRLATLRPEHRRDTPNRPRCPSSPAARPADYPVLINSIATAGLLPHVRSRESRSRAPASETNTRSLELMIYTDEFVWLTFRNGAGTKVERLFGISSRTMHACFRIPSASEEILPSRGRFDH